MAIASITQWLADPNRSYQHGRALYEQYGDDRITLTLIKSGSGSYHLSKLTAALVKINQQPAVAPKPIVIPDVIIAPAISTPAKAAPELDNAPDQVRELHDQKNLRYARARKLHESIRLMDDPEHRLQAGLELLDLMDQVNEAWAAIDEWTEHGKITEAKQLEIEKSVAELSLAELMKEAKNLPPNISKDKSKLEKAKAPAAQAKFAARLQERQLRYEQVKTRLENELVQK